MKSRFLIIVGSAVGAILILWIALPFFKSPDKNIYDAIPTDAVIVFEANQTGPLWQKIKTETAYWKSVSTIDFVMELDQQLLLLDSLIQKSNIKVYEGMNIQKMALSMHQINDTYGIVFVAETRNNLKMYELPELAEKAFGSRVTIVDREVGKYHTAMLVDNQRNLEYSYCITNGLFIGSFKKELLELAVRQLESKQTLLSDPDFMRVRETRGGMVDGYLFVNPHRFSNIVSDNAAEIFKSVASQVVQKSGSWLALDVTVKSNELLFNGFALPKKDGIFTSLNGQQAVEQKLLNILPYNTRLFLQFGMSDFNQFHALTVDQRPIDLLSSRFGVDLREGFINQIKNEVAIGFRQGLSAEEVFFVTRLKDKEIVAATLNRLIVATNGKNNFENGEAYVVNASNLVSILFGNQFALIENFVFVMVDDYLIVANNSRVVNDVLRLYKSGRTLDLNDNFNEFANNISDASNILIYGNIREGLDLMTQFVDSKMLYHMNRNQSVLSEFEAFALQFSASDQLVYTSIYLKHNPNYKEESLIAWKTTLDAPIIAKPYIVEDQETGKNNIIVFDEGQRMYLISPDGQILWKKQLSESPMSEVFEVDYYKNNKMQYLFNTENYMHLIDRNGQYVGNYPVKLRSQATNGLMVFDYENKKNYRILISGADKKTYNYELKGLEVNGWEKPRSLDIVTKPIERLVANDLDYIIITDIKGNIKIVDRRGQVRVSPKGDINKAMHSDFYINMTNSKGSLLSTNNDGKLLYISSTGMLSTTDFGYYSKEHFFLYEDFTQNRTVDFIFLDGNNLQIFDRFKKSLFSYQFKNTINSKPVFFKISQKKRLLGVVDDVSKEIYLIDKDGKIIIGAGLTGEIPFAVGSLHANDEINLITGIGTLLINYQIY